MNSELLQYIDNVMNINNLHLLSNHILQKFTSSFIFISKQLNSLIKCISYIESIILWQENPFIIFLYIYTHYDDVDGCQERMKNKLMYFLLNQTL